MTNVIQFRKKKRTPPEKQTPEMELAVRLERIKASVKRINDLMAELRNVDAKGREKE